MRASLSTLPEQLIAQAFASACFPALFDHSNLVSPEAFELVAAQSWIRRCSVLSRSLHPTIQALADQSVGASPGSVPALTYAVLETGTHAQKWTRLARLRSPRLARVRSLFAVAEQWVGDEAEQRCLDVPSDDPDDLSAENDGHGPMERFHDEIAREFAVQVKTILTKTSRLTRFVFDDASGMEGGVRWSLPASCTSVCAPFGGAGEDAAGNWLIQHPQVVRLSCVGTTQGVCVPLPYARTDASAIWRRIVYLRTTRDLDVRAPDQLPRLVTLDVSISDDLASTLQQGLPRLQSLTIRGDWFKEKADDGFTSALSRSRRETYRPATSIAKALAVLPPRVRVVRLEKMGLGRILDVGIVRCRDRRGRRAGPGLRSRRCRAAGRVGHLSLAGRGATVRLHDSRHPATHRYDAAGQVALGADVRWVVA